MTTENNKKESDQACINPIEDQRRAALKHYQEASSAIHHWSGFVEAAIQAYNPATPIEGEIKSKEAKDYIHLGIEFSQREQFKDSGASYISGVGFGYSCGYQDGKKDATQFTASKEKEYREALEKILAMKEPGNNYAFNRCWHIACKALNK